MGITPVILASRDKAEQAIWNRLQHLKALKARRRQACLPLRIGILGMRWDVQQQGAQAVVPYAIMLRFLFLLLESSLFCWERAAREGVQSAH